MLVTGPLTSAPKVGLGVALEDESSRSSRPAECCTRVICSSGLDGGLSGSTSHMAAEQSAELDSMSLDTGGPWISVVLHQKYGDRESEDEPFVSCHAIKSREA